MPYSAPTFVASGTNAYVISNNVLYDYNTNTGALLSALLVGSFQSLAVSGSSLLGIASNGSIDTINPQTGVVTVLNSEAFGSGFWQANGFVATTTDAYALSAGNFFMTSIPLPEHSTRQLIWELGLERLRFRPHRNAASSRSSAIRYRPRRDRFGRSAQQAKERR